MIQTTGGNVARATKSDGVTIVSGALIPESRDGQYEAVHDKARRLLWDLKGGRAKTFSWPVVDRVEDEQTLYVRTDAIDTFEARLGDGAPVDAAEPYLARWLQMLPSTETHVRVLLGSRSLYVWPVRFVKSVD